MFWIKSKKGWPKMNFTQQVMDEVQMQLTLDKGEDRATDVIDIEIVAYTNGHRWIVFGHRMTCFDCGHMRNMKDDNKKCKGGR